MVEATVMFHLGSNVSLDLTNRLFGHGLEIVDRERTDCVSA
jgi:hypothetical protein